jgi:hypothetical protein
VTAIAALTRAPLLLAPAIALYGTELVVSVHRGELAIWNTPLLAVGLLLVYEAGELRHRLPSGSVIETGPLRALARRVAVTLALGLVAAVVVLAAASPSSGGAAAAAVVGGACAAVAVLLVGTLAARAPVDDEG